MQHFFIRSSSRHSVRSLKWQIGKTGGMPFFTSSFWEESQVKRRKPWEIKIIQKIGHSTFSKWQQDAVTRDCSIKNMIFPWFLQFWPVPSKKPYFIRFANSMECGSLH